MTMLAQSEVVLQRNTPLRSVSRTVKSVITTLLAAIFALLLLAAIALAVLVHTGPAGELVVLNHPVYSVASGSMTPTFRTGDLIIDRSITGAQATALHAGQIVTFRVDSPATGGAPIIVTHRIFAVSRKLTSLGVPAVTYTTKGDANNAPDSWAIGPTTVQGLYETRIPFGGYALTALHRPLTFILLIMIPFAYFVFLRARRHWIAIGEAEAREGGSNPIGEQ